MHNSPVVMIPYGDLSPLGREQDFWIGAKPSTSSSPVSADYFINKQSPQFEPSPEEIPGFIDDYTNIYNLDDALLPDHCEFGPEDLFSEVLQGIPSENTFPTDLPSFTKNSAEETVCSPQNVKYPQLGEIALENLGNLQDRQSQQEHYGNGLSAQASKSKPVGGINSSFDNEGDQSLELYGADVDFDLLFELASEVTTSRLDGPPSADDTTTSAAYGSSMDSLPCEWDEQHHLGLDESDALLNSLLSDGEDEKSFVSESGRMPLLNAHGSSHFPDEDSAVLGFADQESTHLDAQSSARTTDEIESHSPGLSSIFGLASPSALSDTWSGTSTCGSSPGLFGVDDYGSPLTSPMLCSPSSTGMSPLQIDEIEVPNCRVSHRTIITEAKGKAKKSKIPSEIKYLRKKQQNKEAAVRYRQKKKKEIERQAEILVQEEDENKRLKEEFTQLQQEVRFVKKLVRESLGWD